MARAQGSGAAALVPLLLAFLREPARERPRYTVGREPIPGGDHVLRFAQGRFPPQVIAKTTPAERIELREAAQAFIRQVCLWDNATHYQVLCVAPDARRDAIKENYHLLMALIHPDRRDADSAAWPGDCAQRANLAWATLMDESSRREYDATLERARATHHAPPLAGERREIAPPMPGARIAAAAVAVSAITAAFVAFEAFFPDDDPRESALLGHWSASRSADAAAARSPRFIATSPAEAQGREKLAAKAPFELPVLAPLWRAITRPEPVHEDGRTQGSKAPPAIAPPPPENAEPPSLAPPTRVAQVVEPAAPAKAAAEPAAPAAPTPAAVAGIRPEDIEIVVVRLIDSYEAGDIERLMALVDPRIAGYAPALAMRQSYGDFFRATRGRKLRVSNLDWQDADHSARARGSALLQVEYADARGMVERPVDLEMDIALREGVPRIVRLKLFPNAS